MSAAHYYGDMDDQERRGVALSTPTVMALVNSGSAGVQAYEQYISSLERARAAALSQTAPSDWVVSASSSGPGGEILEMATLSARGVSKIAEVYGVSFTVGPQDDAGFFSPRRVGRDDGSGAYGYRCWTEAHSQMTGRREKAEMTRWSDEAFAGRQVGTDGAILKRGGGVSNLDSDLRQAAVTGARRKALSLVVGISEVPLAELDRAWEGNADRSTDQCPRGQGYGSSASRGGGGGGGKGDGMKPASAQVIRRIGELAMKIAGGSHDKAAEVLREASSAEMKDGKIWSVDHPDKIRLTFQATRTLKKLEKMHREAGSK